MKQVRSSEIARLILAWGLLSMPACGEVEESDEGTPSEAQESEPMDVQGSSDALVSSVSFQDGQLPSTSYTGTRDTMLEASAPTTTNGTDTALSVDGDDAKNALLLWDVSASIPTTATVQSASITLVVSDKSSDTFTLYEAKQTWDESKASWNVYATGSNWQVAGGAGSLDRGTTALGSFSAGSTGTYTITLNAAGIAVVQNWVANPSANHGFFLVGPSSTNRLEFRSSEYGTKSQRPKLTVSYDTTSGGGGGGEVTLDPTPGNYKGTCDGSLAVGLDATYFLDGNDENQTLRIYKRGANATPVQTKEISSMLGLSSSDEADLEDAALVGSRMYGITSHGRDKNGNLERPRYRFFGLNISGAAPSLTITSAGYTSTLLDNMLVSANWVTPDATIISLLNNSSQLSKATVASLAPKVNGTNIEGLAWLPTAQRPNQLVIGFRNPHSGADAIMVSLLNADAVLGGATPSFGEATLLDLEGLGVRAMTWSPVHNALLILGGIVDEGGAFRLFKWSGVATELPVPVQDLTAPSDSAPEAIVLYPNTHDVQVLFDQGDHLISGTGCKDASSSSRYFSDVIVHVP
ncbi:MAG: DUF3616 domain-containing protein [Myxococcales bacterium]